MDLLVIRHGLAGDREEFARTGRPDSERPLTPRGRSRMRKGARGLRALVPEVHILGTSPYVRAAQTAGIVAEEYGLPPAEPVPALTPSRRPATLLPWLERHADAEVVAVAGHDPHLPALVSWLLTGRAEPVLVLDKGGACLLDLGDAPRAGEARLLWLLTAKQLRRMGRGR